MAAGDVADGLEVARLGQHDAEVHHRRFHDHAGGLAALLGEPLDPALHRAGVVERDRDRQVDDGLRNARAVRQRGEVLVVSDLVVLDADRDHHAVVMSVVGAEDLDDRLAAGGAAGDADGVHRGLRPAVREAPLRQPPAAGELITYDDRVLGRRREVRAGRVALVDRGADRGMAVTLDHRAEAVVEVPHLVAVDVPHARPGPALQVDGPRVAQLVGGRDTAGEVDLSARVHLVRALRAVVELLLLALDELRDALAGNLNWCVGGHGYPVPESDWAARRGRARQRRSREPSARRHVARRTHRHVLVLELRHSVARNPADDAGGAVLAAANSTIPGRMPC